MRTHLQPESYPLLIYLSNLNVHFLFRYFFDLHLLVQSIFNLNKEGRWEAEEFCVSWFLHSVYTIVLLSTPSDGWWSSFHHGLGPAFYSMNSFHNSFTEWLLHRRNCPRHRGKLNKTSRVTDPKVFDCGGGSATWKLEPGSGDVRVWLRALRLVGWLLQKPCMLMAGLRGGKTLPFACHLISLGLLRFRFLWSRT